MGHQWLILQFVSPASYALPDTCAKGLQLPSAGVLISTRMRLCLSIRCFQKALQLFGISFASSTCSHRKGGAEATLFCCVFAGAHLNAAITLTHCILGNLPWRKLPAYLIGQFLGSFMAAATVFALYYDALYDYTKGNFTVTGPTATASIFSTYPAPYVSLVGGFFTEVTTVMLLLGILIIHDEKNNAALKGTQALLTGILVLGIGLGMGLNTGYAINPSRDLPPRVFTAVAGWGMDVFTAGHNWWWVPLTAPTLGSLAGVFIHKLFIDFHNHGEGHMQWCCWSTPFLYPAGGEMRD
uniref:Aquaporin-7 n=1 Tax=Strix occidentalis caurina TaxID=311401 RepID=A0A8D0FSV6_STROC